MPSLAITIPTYRRSHLLIRLIEDLVLQSVHPDYIIVIDGDPDSGDVLEKLRLVTFPGTVLIYVPSNYPNVAYQRYLGWRVAEAAGCDLLLYLDDDLRFPQKNALEKVIAPFAGDDSDVVGVTASIITGDLSKHDHTEALQDRNSASSRLRNFALKLGAQKNLSPGALGRTGHRVTPKRNEQQDYAEVEWLYGRVMAYRMGKLAQDCFSDDLFALFHVRLALGEDTFMSRCVGSRGKMLMAFDTQIQHPDDDAPQAYPYQAKKYAYATAYSRRFLNDHYRGLEPPMFSDRLVLLRSYFGVTMLNWLEALLSFRRYRYAYAWGYTTGAIRGIIQKPTVRNLTPNIDWWADAEKALAAATTINQREISQET